jgi:hypothetical protein
VTEARSEDLFGNPRLRGAPTQEFIQLAAGKEVSIPGAGHLCTDAAKEDEIYGQ